MITFICSILFFTMHSLCALPTSALPLAEQFKTFGYVEMDNPQHGTATFDTLYKYFDELVTLLQTNPRWTQKLYCAKERFIRSKDRNYYATNFFGLYDESSVKERSQIAFYYSTHFHDFISTHYPEIIRIPEFTRFFDACCEIQKNYGKLFEEAATTLELKTLFSSNYGQTPILFKVMKYLPSYKVTRPHYDGTAFSLLLDSTDNQSLLLSPYKSSYTVSDFSSPRRMFRREAHRNSILLIPGVLLTEFSIYPTPHIVAPNGAIRHATIAFAMRPNYTAQRSGLTPLPNFQH